MAAGAIEARCGCTAWQHRRQLSVPGQEPEDSIQALLRNLKAFEKDSLRQLAANAEVASQTVSEEAPAPRAWW